MPEDVPTLPLSPTGSAVALTFQVIEIGGSVYSLEVSLGVSRWSRMPSVCPGYALTYEDCGFDSG
jgi:hypothetical protein